MWLGEGGRLEFEVQAPGACRFLQSLSQFRYPDGLRSETAGQMPGKFAFGVSGDTAC